MRFQIVLSEGDYKVLRQLADKEYRELRQQAGILIRESLERRGLLSIPGVDTPKEAVTHDDPG